MIFRRNWGEDRVYFYDAEGRLISLPAQWTSVVADDPFVAIATGRSHFRVEDLLKLVRLLKDLSA